MLLAASIFFISACSLNFSPEQAVVQEVQAGRMIGPVVPGSIKIMQKREYEERTLVMAAFQSTLENGAVLDCTYVFSPEKRFGSWLPQGGGGGCGSAPDPSPAIGIGGGIHANEQGVYSYAYGQVYSPEVIVVEVTWDNGEKQSEKVINHSFLVYRLGGAEIQKVQAYGADQQIIFTYEDQGPAPGKQ